MNDKFAKQLDDANLKTGFYKYKGNNYRIAVPVEMKNPETGKWQVGVMYIALMSHGIFVRELQDFVEKFEYMGEKDEDTKSKV